MDSLFGGAAPGRAPGARDRRTPGLADGGVGLAADAAPASSTRLGWAPLAAAALVALSALPALVSLPPLDRDEARFAQSTAQMLETGDFIDIRFQDAPRDKKPVGINWLQSIGVALASSAEQRAIWAYRLPSLGGAMLAAAACVWGARAFLERRAALWAGVLFASGFLLTTEAFIAKTDAALCGATTLSLAALAHAYAAGRAGRRPPRGAAPLFWMALAVAILLKGPVAPMVIGLLLLSLWVADRDLRWAGRLGWGWGLLFLLAVIGPWSVAITVATDGAFWSRSIAGDIAPKLAKVQETHGAPPGFYLLTAPLLMFPAAFLLPGALVQGWRRRREPLERFALAWLLPAWLVFEAAPTKLVHYTLPLYGALAWLAAAALAQPLGRWSARLGALLSIAAGVVLAAGALGLASAFAGPPAAGGEGLGLGSAWTWIWAWITALLCLAAGSAGAWTALSRVARPGASATLALGLAAHVALTAGLAPRLGQLWVSERAARLLQRAGLDPRDGLTIGPVVVAGYAEPSLVFALGTDTLLGDGVDAAEALADGQPALVEARQEPAFLAALKRERLAAAAVGRVSGFDYSDRRPVTLTLWRAQPAAPPVARPAPVAPRRSRLGRAELSGGPGGAPTAAQPTRR